MGQSNNNNKNTHQFQRQPQNHFGFDGYHPPCWPLLELDLECVVGAGQL
jgi:hypothetical protein